MKTMVFVDFSEKITIKKGKVIHIVYLDINPVNVFHQVVIFRRKKNLKTNPLSLI